MTRWRAWLVWFGVLAAVTVALLPARARLDEVYVALAYLVVVQLGSAAAGRRLGIALAGVAFLLLDYCFVRPFGTFAVARPVEWTVLGAFLATSVIAAHLLERVRREARTAELRANEVVRLSAVAERADALREAARLKDDLLASVSHDLRTPLTTIKALAHDLASGGDERAMTIEEEADRLTALVTNLLDLSRLSSGMAMVAPQPNEAEDLVGAALQRTAGATRGRDVRVQFAEAEPFLFGRFDFAQTLRVLANLLENAAKYSPAGTPIDLAVRREGAWLSFAVSDRGPGVPARERARIFEPFYRPPGLPPDVAGAGLGLAIARAITAAQEGTLDVADREGGGSVFTMRVPALDVTQLAAEPALAPPAAGA